MSPLTYYILLSSSLLTFVGIARYHRAVAPVCRVLVWLVMTLFAGLRVGLGRDYFVYVNAYTDPLNYSRSLLEPLWRLNIYVCHDLMGLPFHLWLMAIAGVTYAVVLWGIERWRLDWTVVIIAYMLIYSGYFETLNTMRQCLATSITFAGLPYMLERRWGHFVGLVLLATLVHTSALVALTIYPLSRIRWSTPWLLLALVISWLVGRYLLADLVGLLSHLAPSRYEVYLEHTEFRTDSHTGTYHLLLLGIALFITLYLKICRQGMDERIRVMSLMIITAVCIYNTFWMYEPPLRLMRYFFCALPSLIAVMATERSERPWVRLAALGIIGAMTAFMLKDVIAPEEPLAHYQTVFELSLPDERIYGPQQ